jgi:hypothetical protein
MTNEDELLNSFQSQQSSQNQGFTFFDAQPKQQESTLEEKDLQRLEGDIHSIFESRRLLNKAIATFCAVVGSSAGIHLFARLGIPAIASGTLGGIVIAVCLGNVLTKIRIDQGRPTIDGEFSLALAQALAVTGAMWFGSRELRQLQDEARQGKSEFVTDTKLRSNVVELQECMTLEKSSDTKSGLTMPRSRRIVSNKALAKVGLNQILLSNKGKT